MVGRRKQLRNSVTKVEDLLWQRLRKSQLGMKFIRQYSVDNYVVDFYCPKLKLAIELDGGSHMGKQIYDRRRTQMLNAFGLKEIRFWNDEIEKDMEKVIFKIRSHFRGEV